MLARAVRSGVVESYHDGAVAVTGIDGRVFFERGDIDRPFFFRSAVKPFQAIVSLEAGARLNRDQIAVACSSHGGQPVHRALVASILADAGLDESALQCPPDRPLSRSADLQLAAGGSVEAARIYHNCSGKHAAALSACVAAGWPTDSYTAPDHPYQVRVRELVADVTGAGEELLGVDGCGFPTLRGTTRSLSKAFTRLALDDRFHLARDSMMAMPALTSDGDRPEAALMQWLPAAVKGGAVSCVGLALVDRFGMAAKCWDGNPVPLYVGVIEVLDRLGVLEPGARSALAPHARPPLLGGGDQVGEYEPALD